MEHLNNKSIGFIGLGAMGRPMVTNLAQKSPQSCQIFVHDIVTSVVQDVCGQFPGKLTKCSNAREVADKSAIVVTMLPEGSHVRSVYLDTQYGICAADISNKLLVDSSTIDTATCLDVKNTISTAFPTTAFYDAPVSGGVLGANKGTIAFFLGCADNDPNLPRLKELLGTMGGRIIPCGGPSLGLAAKLSNNYLAATITVACSEAFDMGIRAGLDANVLKSVFASGTAQNAICDTFNPVPGLCPESAASRDYKGGFRVELARKDYGLAADMADRVGSRVALREKGLEIYDRVADEPKYKGSDVTVVYRYLGGKEDWKKTKTA